ncbi:MAG: hypothetical protein ABIJ28_00240 [Patescibacteria group bacterium]
MDNELINQIQRRVIKLLKKNNSKPLYLLAKDNCSEISRLVGCWIFHKIKNCKIFILKGENVMGQKKRYHDILAIKDDDYFYLIDPTVWQFFKNKRKILVGIIKNFKNVSDDVQKIYKGKWKISEELKMTDCRQKKEWMKIINLNTKN